VAWVEIVGHSAKRKGRDNREPKTSAKPRAQSSTLPMSGMWKRSHVEPLRPPQTKGAATDMFYLTPPRHISTLPN